MLLEALIYHLIITIILAVVADEKVLSVAKWSYKIH